jgi:Tol biopolymer transport system component
MHGTLPTSPLPTSAIFTIDPNGKDERQLTDPDPGIQDSGPDWSPDGRRITFERCRNPVSWCEVWTVGADGTGEKRLGPDCLHVGPLPACEWRGWPAYAPDAKIAFGRGYVAGDGVLHGELDVMDGDDAGGTILGTILTVPGPLLPVPIAGAAWQYAPDGARLVVNIVNSALGTPPDAIALYVLEADGSSLRRITPYELRAGDGPDWSPDGRWILFRSNAQSTDAVGSQLYLVRPDGTDLRQLSHFEPGTRVLSSSFSPDGRWITVGLSGVGGQPDVYVMRTNGRAIRPVTRTLDWDSSPDWGPRR